MKIKFSYQPSEAKRVYLLVSFIKGFLGNSGAAPRVKERCEHPPYRHIYITSKPPAPDQGDGA